MLRDNVVCAWGRGGGVSCGGPIQCKGMGGEKASRESNSEEGGENS